MLTVLCGDALGKLRELPDESVQCCVTSPPYWGLRDYGTAAWEGGDEGCDHSPEMRGSRFATPVSEKQRSNNGSGSASSRDCPCGAKRIDSQLGLEKTPEEYVAKMVEVFREVRRVLRRDGTLWLNLGSSYASGDMQPNQSPVDVPACGSDDIAPQDSQNADRACPDSYGESQGATQSHFHHNVRNDQSGEQGERPLLPISHDNAPKDSVSSLPLVSEPSSRASNTRASWRRDRAACVPSTKVSASRPRSHSSSADVPQSVDNSWLNNPIFRQKFKPKDMVPIPWMVAMALQADGWWLRSDIIWAKPNPMPESVTDRPTKAHEYLFLLSKSATYFYDAEAIKEPQDNASLERLKRGWNGDGMRGYPNGPQNHLKNYFGKTDAEVEAVGGRNKRSVWTVATAPYPEAHFATYPPDLIKPCIMAGSRVGDTVLDPFGGSGTTGMVALELGRKAILIELNPKYCELIEQRCDVTPGLPLA
jgi:DNA modification methylase